jgi:YesN/AraC family two-component response regulator
MLRSQEMMREKVAAIIALLDQAGAAHGKYETEVLNGVYDQEWHIWYAQWAVEHGLNTLLTKPIDAERLSTILYSVNEQHRQTDRRQSWAEFTAERLAVLPA